MLSTLVGGLTVVCGIRKEGMSFSNQDKVVILMDQWQLHGQSGCQATYYPRSERTE